MSRYYVGAYWGPRPESRSVCAEHALAMFTDLAKIDPRLGQWYRKGWTKKEARRHRVILSQLGLAQVFKKYGDETSPWFSLDLWNGDFGPDNATVALECGDDSKYVSNSCRIYLQIEDEPPKEPWTREKMSKIVRVLVRTWDPSWAVATSDTERDTVMVAEFARFAGALTYFADRYGKLPPLPPEVAIERIDSLGTLIKRPEGTVADPSYLSLAKQVNALLDEAKLLRREDQDARRT